MSYDEMFEEIKNHLFLVKQGMSKCNPEEVFEGKQVFDPKHLEQNGGLEKTLSTLKGMKLRDISIKLVDGDAFYVETTVPNELSLAFSNRGPSAGELRSHVLIDYLEYFKKTTPEKTVYEVLIQLAKRLDIVAASVAIKWIAAGAVGLGHVSQLPDLGELDGRTITVDLLCVFLNYFSYATSELQLLDYPAKLDSTFRYYLNAYTRAATQLELLIKTINQYGGSDKGTDRTAGTNSTQMLVEFIRKIGGQSSTLLLQIRMDPILEEFASNQNDLPKQIRRRMENFLEKLLPLVMATTPHSMPDKWRSARLNKQAPTEFGSVVIAGAGISTLLLLAIVVMSTLSAWPVVLALMPALLSVIVMTTILNFYSKSSPKEKEIDCLPKANVPLASSRFGLFRERSNQDRDLSDQTKEEVRIRPLV